MALDFVKPGTCRNTPLFMPKLAVYPDLHLAGHGDATPMTPNSPGALHFTVGQPDIMPQGWESKTMWMAWINQDSMAQVRLSKVKLHQHVASLTSIQYTPVTMDGSTIKADLPEGLFGIVYTVLTDTQEPKTAYDLVSKTLAGPLPIPLGPGTYDQ